MAISQNTSHRVHAAVGGDENKVVYIGDKPIVFRLQVAFGCKAQLQKEVAQAVKQLLPCALATAARTHTVINQAMMQRKGCE